MNRRCLEPPSDSGRSRRSGSVHHASPCWSWSRYSIDAMWGSIELEPEVRSWYLNLNDVDAERVRFHFDRLAELGPLLDEPHTRQLVGKLMELRFYLAAVPRGCPTGSPLVGGSSSSRYLRSSSGRNGRRSVERFGRWSGVFARSTPPTTLRRSEEHDKANSLG